MGCNSRFLPSRSQFWNALWGASTPQVSDFCVFAPVRSSYNITPLRTERRKSLRVNRYRNDDFLELQGLRKGERISNSFVRWNVTSDRPLRFSLRLSVRNNWRWWCCKRNPTEPRITINEINLKVSLRCDLRVAITDLMNPIVSVNGSRARSDTKPGNLLLCHVIVACFCGLNTASLRKIVHYFERGWDVAFPFNVNRKIVKYNTASAYN